jgi:hypothetical protein
MRQLTPMLGPSCAGVSPGKTLCSAGVCVGFSWASLSGARVALSLSVMMLCTVKDDAWLQW